jgi:predicted amidohydrolase YtcJ
MPADDLVIQGTVLTVDELKPTADAIAVSDGRIVAVGDRSDVESWIGNIDLSFPYLDTDAPHLRRDAGLVRMR